MPFIRRMKPLAAVVVLVASSLIASGCRTSALCDRCCQTSSNTCAYASPPPGQSCQCANAGVAGTTSVVSLGAPVGQEPLRAVAQTPVSRPLWRVARRNSRQHATAPVMPNMAPTATPCEQCTTPRQQTAMMLRPVPLGAPLPESSEWSPVQRVSAESADRPQAVSFVPSTQPGAEPPLIASPSPQALVLADLGKGEKDAPKKDEKVKPEATLPHPKPVNGGKKGHSSAWPELPAPVITNPPHAPREFQKHALSAYIIEPPDVLQIEAVGIGFEDQPITGPHLVRPDGTIGLGTFGSVFVAGMTIDQAKMRIVERILESLSRYTPPPRKDRGKGEDKAKVPEDRPKTPEEVWAVLKVDVAAFNSKFYYVVTDGGGYGEQVFRVPITGNETVLDAISQIQGLPAVASKHQIWLARATPHDHHSPQVLPVDWCGIVQRGSAATNYQVFPGDRVYVNSAKLIRLDSKLAKIISPIERLLGITLLGSTTVNSIQGNQGGGGGGGNR